MRTFNDLFAVVPQANPGTGTVEGLGARNVDAKQTLAVGSYTLGMPVPDGIDLTEAYDNEYKTVELSRSGLKHYLVPPANFLGFRWMTMVAVVNNAILGIRATTFTENLTETIQGLTLVQEWYSEKLGDTVERKNRNAFCSWRSSNANVEYQVFPNAWPCRNEIRLTSLKMSSGSEVGHGAYT